MAKKADTPIAEFQLRAVELHEIAVGKTVSGVAVDNFSFEINIETNIDRHQSVVISSTRVRIFAGDKVTELGRVNCACIFSVSNLDEVIAVKNDNSIELIESFTDTINSISISTTRGMMASELKGTILHHAFLPIIDVKSLSKASVL